MPLIEVPQSRYVSATIRLDAATATLIDQYATFVHASADDVVDKAVNYVFSKDREFQEYLKTARPAMLYPLCGSAGVGMGKHLNLPPMAGGPSQGWRWIMRCLVNPFQKRNSCLGEAFGASHRVYFDTPPLKGLRMQPDRLQMRSCRNG
jgi:hypothetical protein